MGKKKKVTVGAKVVTEVLEWAESFVFAIFSVILIFIFLFRIVLVDGGSMNPTLTDGDRLIITHLNYTPKNGDIVVLNSDGLKKTIIKRCIGVTGDTIRIDFNEKTVERNGEVLTEKYINGEMEDKLRFNQEKLVEDGVYEWEVPEGKIFVMGDNRNHSEDSRTETVGFVDLDDVMGKAFFRIVPFGSFGKIG